MLYHSHVASLATNRRQSPTGQSWEASFRLCKPTASVQCSPLGYGGAALWEALLCNTRHRAGSQEQWYDFASPALLGEASRS